MTEGIVKTNAEIDALIRAAQIIDDAYDAVLEAVKAGDSEKEVAELIEKFVIGHGASGLSFETIVAFGKGGAEPHHVPTDAKLERGMLVTIDMGAVYDGYCSDFTRTFAFGEINEKQRRIYDVVYRSQRLGVQAARAGMRCEELDRVCRDYIEANGFGQYFIHTTGHGLGRVVHEAPRVGKNSEDVLDDNMVITVEPGIYLPDEMGVRIEDMVIVGREGALSRHSTELIVIDR